ncbi:hypothetical protein LCGC14_0814250 [marine sediment metagenome]|uniref:Uncharacterized protein n=1 Tax=marine sediment metagenome TaxID=412755 RepID=A0A0F9Q618_9ZZZZ
MATERIPPGYKRRWYRDKTTGARLSELVFDRELFSYQMRHLLGGTSGGFGKFEMPEMGEAPQMGPDPEYDAPQLDKSAFQVDEGRLSELRQKAMNPLMRGVRQNLRESMVANRVSDNPYANALMQGRLLSGTGSAIESASGAAGSAAASQYAPEFAGRQQAAGLAFQGAGQRAGAMYQGAQQRQMAGYQGALQRHLTGYQGRLTGAMATFKAQQAERMSRLKGMQDLLR